MDVISPVLCQCMFALSMKRKAQTQFTGIERYLFYEFMTSQLPLTKRLIKELPR